MAYFQITLVWSPKLSVDPGQYLDEAAFGDSKYCQRKPGIKPGGHESSGKTFTCYENHSINV